MVDQARQLLKQGTGKAGSNRSLNSDRGAISFGNLVTLVVLALFVWAMVAFFPVVNIPFELQNQVKDRSLDFLRKTPSQKAQKSYQKQMKGEIAQTVGTVLEGHEFDPKEVENNIVIEGSRYISVSFEYTLIIDYLGMEFTFDKEFDHTETISF